MSPDGRRCRGLNPTVRFVVSSITVRFLIAHNGGFNESFTVNDVSCDASVELLKAPDSNPRKLAVFHSTSTNESTASLHRGTRRTHVRAIHWLHHHHPGDKRCLGCGVQPCRGGRNSIKWST